MARPVKICSEPGHGWRPGLGYPKRSGGIRAPDKPAPGIHFHLDGLTEEGLEIPEPRPPDQIAVTAKATGATLLAVTAHKARRRRINITFPQGLLREVDRLANERGMARSELLVRSARDFLKRHAGA